MTKKPFKLNQKGFTMVEMLVAMTAMAILAAIFMPSYMKSQVDIRLVDGLKNNIQNVGEAARLYRMDCGVWPTSINDLKSIPAAVTCTGNVAKTPYLPTNYNFINQLGSGAPVIASDANSFTLTVPISSNNVSLKGHFTSLPGYSTTAPNATSFSASFIRPGLEASLSTKVDRTGDTMTGNLIMDGTSDIYITSTGKWVSQISQWKYLATTGTNIPKPSCTAGVPSIFGAIASDSRSGGAYKDTVNDKIVVSSGVWVWARDNGPNWTVFAYSLGSEGWIDTNGVILEVTVVCG